MELSSGQRIELPQGERNFTVSSVSAKRVFLCRYEDEEWVRPRLGEIHPIYPWLVCSSVSCKDLDAIDDDTGDTKYSKIEAMYTATVPRDLPIRTLDVSGEALETTKGRAWVSDAVTVDQSTAVFYPMMSFSYEFTPVSVPFETILYLTNKVNSAAWKGLAAGTVLFEGASSRTEYTDSGIATERISLYFLYRPVGHNYVWRDDTGAWDQLNPALYGTADFSVLGI